LIRMTSRRKIPRQPKHMGSPGAEFKKKNRCIKKRKMKITPTTKKLSTKQSNTT
jgi:hypothetical protein